MSEFNIYNVFLHAKHTYHNKTQSWLEQRLVERVRQKGNKWRQMGQRQYH
jgi:hypothetical protein